MGHTRAGVILGFDQKRPTAFGLRNDGLDSLAEQHQTPVHGLPSMARPDDQVGGFRACHAKLILLFICNNICCFGLKIGLGAQLAMADCATPLYSPFAPRTARPSHSTGWNRLCFELLRRVETRRNFCQERVVGRVIVS